ncbi:hypothetical protein ACVIGB_001105 [Bradyrhizobium sp. USDA 4341]
MKRPTEAQIEIARNWLEYNEAGDEEQEACTAVAAWLGHLQQEHMLRQEARKGAVPVSQLRAALRSQETAK